MRNEDRGKLIIDKRGLQAGPISKQLINNTTIKKKYKIELKNKDFEP